MVTYETGGGGRRSRGGMVRTGGGELQIAEEGRAGFVGSPVDHLLSDGLDAV